MFQQVLKDANVTTNCRKLQGCSATPNARRAVYISAFLYQNLDDTLCSDLCRFLKRSAFNTQQRPLIDVGTMANQEVN